MKNKKLIRKFTVLLAALVIMCGFSVTAYAGGGFGRKRYALSQNCKGLGAQLFMERAFWRGKAMLMLIPVSLAEANAFVAQHHRHHKPVTGHKFSIGCTADGQLVGVAIVGRPVSRYLDDGQTLEVNRLCTDGTKNACSMLYAAAWRAARAMGYRKMITYILDTENGASLRAAGWKCAGIAGGKRWTGSRKPATDLYPPQMKYRYEKTV